MSSEKDRPHLPTEDETPKRQSFPYEKEDKRPTADESMGRYYSPSPPPYGMIQRHGLDQHNNRPMMPRPISPHPRQMEDSDFTDAMIFLNRIKEEFSDNLQVYDSFLETLRDFKFEKIDADEVCKAVRILFKDKPFLIRLFDEYLPHHLRFMESRGYEMSQQMAERQKFNQFRGPYMGQPMHMPQMPPNPQMHMGRMGHQVPPQFISRPIRQSPPPVVTHPENAQRFKPTPQPAPESPKHRTAHEFVQLVKKRYMNKPLVYRQFVELLQNSKNSFEKLYTQVSALLIDSPDLVEKFEKNFKMTKENANEPIYLADNDPLKKIKQKLRDQGTLEPFLKIINFYNQNYISSTDLIELVQPILDDKENIAAFKSFIKHTEIPGDLEFKKPKVNERIGSYKILGVKPSDPFERFPLSRDVINLSLISVSTLESEEDTYVFRHKNDSEELLARIVDERSEADLAIDRLRFLIAKLEELYESDVDGILELSSLRMSSSLCRETLRSIYDNNSQKVLEALLNNPKKSLPIILKRLYSVYKENMEKMREYRKYWRTMIEENYYRAYDTKGVYYRSQEKNYLSVRFIRSESENSMVFDIGDSEIMKLVRELFSLFIQHRGSNGFKKPSFEAQLEIYDSLLENFKNEEFNTLVDFETFSFLYFVLILVSRFKELKDMSFPPLSSNPMAVSINLQEEFLINDRFSEIVNCAYSLMRKEIDASKFEDNVRRLSNSTGFKLYNLRKIMAKIEKLIGSRLGEEDAREDEESDGGQYTIIKKGNIISICKAEEIK